MADHEAAARAPPVAVAPPPATPRTAAAEAEAKAALADVVVYCFLSAMFVGCAASIALIVARYAVGERYPYAYAVVAAVARHVFLLALSLWRCSARSPSWCWSFASADGNLSLPRSC